MPHDRHDAVQLCPGSERTLQPVTGVAVLSGQRDDDVLHFGWSERDVELAQATDELVQVKLRRRSNGVERALGHGAQLYLL